MPLLIRFSMVLSGLAVEWFDSVSDSVSSSVTVANTFECLFAFEGCCLQLLLRLLLLLSGVEGCDVSLLLVAEELP